MWRTPLDFIFLLSKMLISLLASVFKGKSYSSEARYLSRTCIFLYFSPHFVSPETTECRSLGIRLIVNISSSYKSPYVQKTWFLKSLLTPYCFRPSSVEHKSKKKNFANVFNHNESLWGSKQHLSRPVYSEMFFVFHIRKWVNYDRNLIFGWTIPWSYHCFSLSSSSFQLLMCWCLFSYWC